MLAHPDGKCARIDPSGRAGATLIRLIDSDEASLPVAQQPRRAGRTMRASGESRPSEVNRLLDT